MTADLSFLAKLLAGHLAKRCADPSPVRDPSETDVVDQAFQKSVGLAEDYLTRRMTYAIGKLRQPVQSGDVVHDGLIVLGAYAHLQELKARVVA
jgi:hypothetical protein